MDTHIHTSLILIMSYMNSSSKERGCFHTIYGDIQILFGIHPAVPIDDLSQRKGENRTKGVKNILFSLNIFPAFDYLCR